MGLLEELVAASDKLARTDKKITDLEREIKVEQDIQAKRTDPTTKPGYNHYVNQLNKMPEKRNAEVVSLESKLSSFKMKKEAEIKSLRDTIETYTNKKEAEINLLRNAIETYTMKKENEILFTQQLLEAGEADYEHKINTINNKRDTLVQEYTEGINRIESTIGRPISIGYDRKKQQLEEYMDRRTEQNQIIAELESKKSQIQQENAREEKRQLLLKERREEAKNEAESKERLQLQRDADNKKQEEKDAIYLKEYKKTMINDSNNSSDSEATVTIEDVVNNIVIAKLPKVTKVKLATYNGQNIKKMTLEEMNAIDDATVPKHKEKEWTQRYKKLDPDY